MKNNFKLGLRLLTVLAAPLVVNEVASSEVQATTGWVQNGNVWYYYNAQGQMVRNAWVGNYWLGADGKMVTNAWVDGNKYYVGNNGAWVKNAQNPTQVKTGWVQSGNTWYHYNDRGVLTRNAWIGNYWLGADGKMATNAWVDNNKYYVGSNGEWVPNAQKSTVKLGWVKNGTTWYHYKTNGALTRGAWVGNYWLGADGKMAVNSWVDNNKYYVGSNGAWVPNAQKSTVKSGWVKNGTTWYHYNTQGVLTRNAWVGNYWLGADGKMAVNSWVDNNKYYVGSDGAWIKNAQKPEEKKTGWVQSGNTWYHYNNQGALTRNAWVGNYWLGADGKMAVNSWVDGGRYYVGSDGAWVDKSKSSTTSSALNMPQYYQGDYRWASRMYGLANMKASGCVPTSLSMIFSGLGQPTTPTKVADVIYNETSEMNVSGVGTSGAGATYAIKRFGYNYSVIQSKEQLVQALQSGKPVFATMGNGIFAKGRLTHAIALSGYSNGKTKAMDPDNAYTTQKWYDVNTIWNQRSTDPYDTMIGGSFVAIGKN